MTEVMISAVIVQLRAGGERAREREGCTRMQARARTQAGRQADAGLLGVFVPTQMR